MQSTEVSPDKMNFGPLFIAFAAFLWTVDAFVRSFVSQEIDAKLLVLFEHVIIIFILLPVLKKYLPTLFKFNLKEWGAILFIGVGGSGLATIALTMGYSYDGGQYIAAVALLQQAQPLFTIGFAALLLKEKLPKFYYILSVIAISGVFMIFWPFLTGFTGEFSNFANTIELFEYESGLVAGLLGLTAAFFWGTSTVFGRYLLDRSDKNITYFQMTSYRFFVALIFLIFLNLFLGLTNPGHWNVSGIDTKTILAVFFIALVPGLLSLISYYYGLKTTHASVATIFELAFPLSLFVLIPLIQPESQPQTVQIIGAVVLMIATTILSYIYAKSNNENKI